MEVVLLTNNVASKLKFIALYFSPNVKTSSATCFEVAGSSIYF